MAPLFRQTISLGFQGLETKSDPKTLLPGKLVRLENATFESPGRLKKRNGYAKLGDTIVAATTTLTDPRALYSYKDELVSADGEKFYSYNATNDTWVLKGAFSSLCVKGTPIVRNTYAQTRPDSAAHESGISVFAWEEAGNVRYSVIDRATGQNIVASKLVLEGATSPKVLAFDHLICIFYVDSTPQLHVATFPAKQPTADLTHTALTAASGSAALDTGAPVYDVTLIATSQGDRIYVAYNNNDAAGGVSLFSFTSGAPGTATASASFSGEGAPVITLFEDLVQKGPVLAYYTGSALKYKAYHENLQSTLGSGSLETLANVVSISGVSRSSSAIAFDFYYSISAAQTYNYLTKRITVSGSYVTGTPAVLMRSVALVGKAFRKGPHCHIPVAHVSPLQSTYFVTDEGGYVLAKLLPGLGTTTAPTGLLAEVNSVSENEFELTLPAKDFLTSDAGQVVTNTGVQNISLHYDNREKSYEKAVLGETLHLSGGVLQAYDGVSVTEAGFHLYPENVSVSASASGGSIGAGTYQYIAVWEWTDGLGHIQRSAPSPAVSVTNSGSTSSNTVSVPTLRITAKQAPRSEVTCAIYRTLANGTVFYQATSSTAPVYNNPNADLSQFVDTQADATIQGRPQLYTTGGVVENVAPASVGPLAVHRNRIFAVDAENPLRLWYSKLLEPNAPVEFSDLFTMTIDARGGDITALASLDDKLVCFKPSSVFVVTGQGPTALGTLNDFSDGILVSSDAGCTNPKSVVLTPQGLMFQSAKGMYLLGRDLSVSYVGADVEAYNSETVTSATLIPSMRQVRFTLDSSRALVYDYLVRQWTIYTNIAGVDATIYKGVYTYGGPWGIFKETPGSFSDAGSPIHIKLETGFISPAALQGFARAYELLVLGEYLSAHSLVVRIKFDFSDQFEQETTLTPAAGSALFGTDTPFGAGSPYGGTFLPYEYRFFFARQKLTSFALELEEVPNGVGEGLSLSAISVNVGLKKGLYAMPAAKSVG